MRKLLPVVALLGAFFTNTAQASGTDLSLSNESANIEVFGPMRGLIENGGLASIGFLYNDLDDVIGHLKLVAVGTQTNTRVPYQLAFGLKGYVGEMSDPSLDVGALAIGGSINIQYPFGYNPLDLNVEAFFTPGITTFGDTESVIEINTRLSIEIVPQAKAFVGYRRLQIEDDSNVAWELDDNVHFGIRLQF
ncbi:MAG: YfaZ family outer membrane protein [Pseudomonadota bacterium]